MGFDRAALRQFLRTRLREVGDMVDALELDAEGGDLLPDYSRTEWGPRERMWGCVEAVMWRVAEQQDPEAWDGWSPDGLRVVKAAKVDDSIHAWGMAWFLGHRRFFLAPFWARVAATATSVAVNADIGERDGNGRLIR